jgi:toxin ParE1/3/4
MYRLSAAAEEDIIHLLAYTHDRFGEVARLRYETLLVVGLWDIASDLKRLGSVARPELGHAVRSYHLRHSEERARPRKGVYIGPDSVALSSGLSRPDRHRPCPVRLNRGRATLAWPIW